MIIDIYIYIYIRSNVSDRPRCKLLIICTSTVYKNVVDKFVVVTLL